MVNDIDLVIPMVFPHDPVWQREYQRFHGSPTAAQHNVRFRSWGTEELLIRCCMKYMPWLRTIHILLASKSQVQPWMLELTTPRPTREGPGVGLTFHADFIPADYLPCFASPCIEMFLHRIPGLAEHFIYSNDDIFPLSPLSPDDFFRPAAGGTEATEQTETAEPFRPLSAASSGECRVLGCSVAESLRPLSGDSIAALPALLPCQIVKEEPFPANPNIFQRKCQYQENMIGTPFAHHATRTWLKNGHSFAPILRTVCEEVHHRHGGEILHHLSPLRRTDHSHNHYIYTLYQHFAHLSVPHAPRQQYVGRATRTADLPTLIAAPTCGILCLNDNETIDDWEHRAEVVQQAIAQKLEV